MMKTSPQHDTASRAMATMLARANGGTTPDRIDLQFVGHGDREAAPAPGTVVRDTLLVGHDDKGEWEATIGIGTHWTMLCHDELRPALTPGGEILFLGFERGRKIRFWVEDDRFHCDTGSSLLSAAQEREAIAAFTAEFDRLQAEMA